MSYEKSPIIESTSAIPAAAPVIMREDREIDPYRRGVRDTRSLVEPNGQPIISKDPVKAEEAVTPEETVTLSPQMAALARKEQKFRREQQELKAKEAQLETERKEIAELKELKAKLAAKDFSGIENLVKYDEYTNYLIEKDSALTPEQQELRALKAKVEGVEAAHKDDVTKRYEAAVEDRRKVTKSLVESSPEFSIIKKAKMEEAVVKHILDTWEEESKELSPEEAAKEVKEILLEKAKAWKALLDEELPPVAEDEKKNLPPLKPGIKTLTNNMAATGEIKRPARSFQHMTDTERYAEARRRAEEKLQQQGR